jgi:hypothetical protein
MGKVPAKVGPWGKLPPVTGSIELLNESEVSKLAAAPSTPNSPFVIFHSFRRTHMGFFRVASEFP